MGGRQKVSAGQTPDTPVIDSYGRLSRVPDTRELEKVETQHADNRKTIDRHGGKVGLELSDGLSAWKRGVRRKDWERLLERVRAGSLMGWRSGTPTGCSANPGIWRR